MKMDSKQTSKPTVAVFGAAGHTGRLVVPELLRRGIVPIAIARDAAALAAANFPENKILRRQANVDDPKLLAVMDRKQFIAAKNSDS